MWPFLVFRIYILIFWLSEISGNSVVVVAFVDFFLGGGVCFVCFRRVNHDWVRGEYE